MRGSQDNEDGLDEASIVGEGFGVSLGEDFRNADGVLRPNARVGGVPDLVAGEG